VCSSDLPLTAMVLRRMVRVRFVSLVNLLVGRAALPELLQQDCEPKKLADALELFLSVPAHRLELRMQKVPTWLSQCASKRFPPYGRER